MNQKISIKTSESKTLRIFLNNSVLSLQHDVSYQLNKALDDSAFPELLLESAVNSVFPVFTGMKKDNTNNQDSNFLYIETYLYPYSECSLCCPSR